MNPQKIAILADSCCDVPADVAKRFNIYTVPLNVIFRNEEFLDGVTIQPDELYKRMETEIPKTSLPSGDVIMNMYDKLKSEGYTHVLAIAISTGLSGTYNAFRLLGEQIEGLEVHAVDTKNIALASGFHAIHAAQMIEQGASFEEIVTTVESSIEKSQVFFCVKTLEYLQKGGRIGMVASILGTALDLKPIITCNKEGIYYTVAKVRGRKQSISRLISLVIKAIGDSKSYNLSLSSGMAKEEASEIKAELLKALPHINLFVEGQISAALAVHTGPGLIGIAFQRLD